MLQVVCPGIRFRMHVVSPAQQAQREVGQPGVATDVSMLLRGKKESERIHSIMM
jgi:hypothetical protein